MLKRVWLQICLVCGVCFSGCENPEVVVVQYDTGVENQGGGQIVIEPESEPEVLLNLVETIRAEPQFQFFADALEFTNVYSLFADETRAYTVVVPTDTAFNQLSNARRAALLSDIDALRELVLAHTAPTVVSSADLQLGEIGMLDGTSRMISAGQFTHRDIEATNGIVHGINSVFDNVEVVPEQQTILQALSEDQRFNGLVAAVQLTSLSDVLADQNRNLTLFAPTDSAFIQFGQAAVLALYQNSALLEDFLSYHIVNSGALTMSDFGSGLPVITNALNGGELTLSSVNGQLFVNGVPVLLSNIETVNGIVYVIETVLQ